MDGGLDEESEVFVEVEVEIDVTIGVRVGLNADANVGVHRCTHVAQRRSHSPANAVGVEVQLGVWVHDLSMPIHTSYRVS